jgi:hypothetical protein
MCNPGYQGDGILCTVTGIDTPLAHYICVYKKVRMPEQATKVSLVQT